jgi:hypothetical protein
LNRLNLLIKLVLSYTKSKSKWDFNDYPIRTWKNPNAGEKKVAFGAGIMNWSLMVGHGETPEKAVQALKERFRLYRNNNPLIPRPGSYVPIKYASTEKINKYRDIAAEFFQKVLNLDYNQGFYSDDATLWPFEGPDEQRAKVVKEGIIMRTKAIFGVDISDIYDQPLYKIFERIRNAKMA